MVKSGAGLSRPIPVQRGDKAELSYLRATIQLCFGASVVQAEKMARWSVPACVLQPLSSHRCFRVC